MIVSPLLVWLSSSRLSTLSARSADCEETVRDFDTFLSSSLISFSDHFEWSSLFQGIQVFKLKSYSAHQNRNNAHLVLLYPSHLTSSLDFHPTLTNCDLLTNPILVSQKTTRETLEGKRNTSRSQYGDSSQLSNLNLVSSLVFTQHSPRVSNRSFLIFADFPSEICVSLAGKVDADDEKLCISTWRTSKEWSRFKCQTSEAQIQPLPF